MMVAASKTGLPHYKNKEGKNVFVAKITAITPVPHQPITEPNAKRLVFGELNKVSDMIGEWIEEQKPEVGGYFVVSDKNTGESQVHHVKPDDFEKDYKKEKKL